MLHKKNDILVLGGRTRKGKNKVREHGKVWRVVRVGSPKTGWSPHGSDPDNEILIEPARHRPGDDWNEHRRWIHRDADPDFNVISINRR